MNPRSRCSNAVAFEIAEIVMPTLLRVRIVLLSLDPFRLVRQFSFLVEQPFVLFRSREEKDYRRSPGYTAMPSAFANPQEAWVTRGPSAATPSAQESGVASRARKATTLGRDWKKSARGERSYRPHPEHVVIVGCRGQRAAVRTPSCSYSASHAVSFSAVPVGSPSHSGSNPGYSEPGQARSSAIRGCTNAWFSRVGSRWFVVDQPTPPPSDLRIGGSNPSGRTIRFRGLVFPDRLRFAAPIRRERPF